MARLSSISEQERYNECEHSTERSSQEREQGSTQKGCIRS